VWQRSLSVRLYFCKLTNVVITHWLFLTGLRLLIYKIKIFWIGGRI
jgi:hypothetical protein